MTWDNTLRCETREDVMAALLQRLEQHVAEMRRDTALILATLDGWKREGRA